MTYDDSSSSHVCIWSRDKMDGDAAAYREAQLLSVTGLSGGSVIEIQHVAMTAIVRYFAFSLT